MKELYISVDIEADGMIPGLNSMLSIGAVAINDKGRILDEYYVTLKELIDARASPATMDFWAKYPDAYKKTRDGAIDPYLAMIDFAKWIKSKDADKNIFVAYPAAFDFNYVHYYFMTMLGRDPFNYNVLDIRTYAMGVLGTSFDESSLNKLSKEYQSSLPHTHVAIEDARQQADVFIALLLAQAEHHTAKKDAFNILYDIASNKVTQEDCTSIADKLRKFTRK